jgi:hypothetical protein
MNAVFFEANHESITQRVHAARRKVLSTNSAYPEFQLFGSNAAYMDVKAAHAKAKGFGLFSGLGHGGSDEFCGQWDWHLYDTADSKTANYTACEAIVHLYSCNCGATLGPFLVKKGSRAFIGYTQPVSVPGNQAVVDEFVKVAAAIDHSIIAGDSSAATKRKADAVAVAVEAALLAPGSPATPRDLALFRMNQGALVGPWTSIAYGSY